MGIMWIFVLGRTAAREGASVAALMMSAMETHLQLTVGPDPATRSITKRLADLCKADAAAFSAVVRATDAARARGEDHEQVRLDALAALGR